MGLEVKTNEPNSDHAVAGAASGLLTRLIGQPLDVIKIRLQLQVEPICHKHVGKYRSLAHATEVIVKEEGIRALWKGHVPAQFLSVIYGTIQFYSYSLMKDFLDEVPVVPEWKKSIDFVAGAAAGSVATIVSFPFDTVRTRLVAQSTHNQIYRGIIHPYVVILRTESPSSFFRGLLPTLIQIAPHTGLQFTFYHVFTNAYKRVSHETETKIGNSMIAGSGAGLLAKTIVYPFDLARKRLQIQGFEHGRVGFGKFFTCRGLVDCIATTARVEGFGGLFKGLAPSQLKAAITTALYFTAYEQVLFVLKTTRQ